MGSHQIYVSVLRIYAPAFLRFFINIVLMIAF